MEPTTATSGTDKQTSLPARNTPAGDDAAPKESIKGFMQVGKPGRAPVRKSGTAPNQAAAIQEGTPSPKKTPATSEGTPSPKKASNTAPAALGLKRTNSDDSDCSSTGVAPPSEHAEEPDNERMPNSVHSRAGHRDEDFKNMGGGTLPQNSPRQN